MNGSDSIEPDPRWGAPDDETGAVVPIRTVLFQDATTAITVTGLVAYSTGFEFTLDVFRRVDDILRLIGHAARHRPDRMLKLAIRYSDGRRATNFDGAESDDISLAGGGGGGGGWTYGSHYWMWPLPPPGPMKLGVEWGGIDLPLTEVEIDAQPIIDAAARSERPWGWAR